MAKKAFWQLIIFTITLINIGVSYGADSAFPLGTQKIFIAQTPGVRSNLLKNIASVVNQSITHGNYPGAIVLVGHQGHIIYKGVFGNRRIAPTIVPMQFDTVFDLASLTKVVATAPAIMQLLEQGKMSLDSKVSDYWPDFAVEGKANITIRELLTHTSGLPADITLTGLTAEARLAEVSKVKLINNSGMKVTYSDLNFIVLAHLVEIISHETFKQYTHDHIFQLLGMSHTGFQPSINAQDKIAPTEMIDNQLRWGVVHDPMAYSMGGVSGNAGLFSTAGDLALYAECLLSGGRLPSSGKEKNNKTGYLLGPLTILKMTSPETPAKLMEIRGLGWDIDSMYSSRGDLFPIQSYGHTGWTGTSLWIDPVTNTYVIILTSRTHPHPAKENQVVQDRKKIANIVAGSLTNIPTTHQSNTGAGELDRAYPTTHTGESFWQLFP